MRSSGPRFTLQPAEPDILASLWCMPCLPSGTRRAKAVLYLSPVSTDAHAGGSACAIHRPATQNWSNSAQATRSGWAEHNADKLSVICASASHAAPSRQLVIALIARCPRAHEVEQCLVGAGIGSKLHDAGFCLAGLLPAYRARHLSLSARSGRRRVVLAGLRARCGRAVHICLRLRSLRRLGLG
jgi:hypothetical protein